jgi:hypothetical protein
VYLIPVFISVLLPEFKLDDKAKTYISQGKKNYDAFCSSLDINYIEVLEYGRKDCRKFGVSPDSLMQLTFQVREIYKFFKVYIAAGCCVSYRVCDLCNCCKYMCVCARACGSVYVCACACACVPMSVLHMAVLRDNIRIAGKCYRN